MPDVLPPAYVESEVQKELDKAAKDAKPLEGVHLISAVDKMAEKAKENESALMREMEQLSGYALDIENRFRKVTKVLTDVRTDGASADMRETYTTLHTKWSEHHEEYVKLLWRSREVAGKARSAIEGALLAIVLCPVFVEDAADFSKTLLPYIQDPTETIESKKEELQNQKKKLDEDRIQAANISQSFNDLSDKVKTFTDDFEVVVKKFNIPAQKEKIKELDVQLQLLKDTLEGLNKKITVLVAALAISAAAAGITGLLGFLCPYFWIGTAVAVVGGGVSGVMLIKAQQERDDTERLIKETEAKRVEAQADLEVIQALQAALTKIRPSTQEICTKLGAFASVWATIRADIQEIEEKIDYAENTTKEKLFLSRIKAIQTMYELLAKGLYKYECMVTKNEEIFEKVNQ